MKPVLTCQTEVRHQSPVFLWLTTPGRQRPQPKAPQRLQCLPGSPCCSYVSQRHPRVRAHFL